MGSVLVLERLGLSVLVQSYRDWVCLCGFSLRETGPVCVGSILVLERLGLSVWVQS